MKEENEKQVKKEEDKIKKKHKVDKIFKIEFKDKKYGFFRYPSFADYSAFISLLKKDQKSKAFKVLVNSLFLEGDNVLKNNLKYFKGVISHLESILAFNVVEYTIEEGKDKFVVKGEEREYTVYLKELNMDDLDMLFSSSNSIESIQRLVNNLWIDGDEEVKNDDKAYVSLLIRFSEIQNEIELPEIKKF